MAGAAPAPTLTWSVFMAQGVAGATRLFKKHWVLSATVATFPKGEGYPPPPPLCLGTALRKNHPLVPRHFPCATFFSHRTGFSWLRWMQGSYSGTQDNISCVLHGNTCIWNAS